MVTPLTLMRGYASMLEMAGELNEQLGNREQAARRYQQFVALWRNADAELQPQVAEVRRRLSRMADVERR